MCCKFVLNFLPYSIYYRIMDSDAKILNLLAETVNGSQQLFGIDRDAMRYALLRSKVPHELNKVEIRPSIVHGNGVFANRDITRGEIVTFYPCDIMIMYPKGRESDARDMVLGYNTPATYDATYVIRNRHHLGIYKFMFDDDHDIIGVPELSTNPTYLGHMANDAAHVEDGDILSYKEISSRGMNVIFERVHGCHVALTAVRDIRKDEEIFVSYGPNYWTIVHSI